MSAQHREAIHGAGGDGLLLQRSESGDADGVPGRRRGRPGLGGLGHGRPPRDYALTVDEGGSLLGNLYCAQRDWNQFTGPVAAGSAAFSVPATWGSEQDALGYTMSQLVTMSATPDVDPTQNFAWFVKLGPTQATGDDTAICAAVRSLVPTLAPAAMN